LNAANLATSFPNSVWERTFAKLCFADAELCKASVRKPELGNK